MQYLNISHHRFTHYVHTQYQVKLTEKHNLTELSALNSASYVDLIQYFAVIFIINQLEFEMTLSLSSWVQSRSIHCNLSEIHEIMFKIINIVFIFVLCVHSSNEKENSSQNKIGLKNVTTSRNKRDNDRRHNQLKQSLYINPNIDEDARLSVVFVVFECLKSFNRISALDFNLSYFNL